MWFVGVMTGTSIDGLDLALLDLPSDLTPKAACTVPLPDDLRENLRRLANPAYNDVDTLGETDVELGRFIAQACVDFIKGNGLQTTDINAIGSHGQTIRHKPEGLTTFTLQIGNGHVIAEEAAIDVIADFRGRDMAVGGEGAPLVPIYHNALFHSPDKARVVVNIGGIANITVLSDHESQLLGFDTGPGNALLDAWIQDCRDEPYDKDGTWASRGEIHGPLLTHLLDDPYYLREPPKSTGKERFNLAYLKEKLERVPQCKVEDVQSTLVELTAMTITDAINAYVADCNEVVICGGGRLNQYLMTRLKTLNENRYVSESENFDVDGDSIEASAFAYLAWRFRQRLPGNVPSVTGASHARVLGCLYPAA